MADVQERIGQSIGDYCLLRLLGKGTFGTVYLAEYLHEHTFAALQVLHFPLTGPNGFRTFIKIERSAFLLKIKQSRRSSAIAKDRLKKMIQHQTAVPVAPAPRLHFLPAWMKLTSRFLIMLIIGGGIAVYLLLRSTQSVPSTQKSRATATVISQAATQHQISTPIPTPSPQHQISTPIPTPTPQPQIPTPTPSVIAPAIPAGELLYSTPHPFSACDKQAGHWTDTSDASVTCTPDGSEVINTSGHPAVANLDQLGGNQPPWLGQDFIVQVQVTINPNSNGAFGIDFQPEASDNAPGYFTYSLSPPKYWTFNYYNTQGSLTNTLIAAPLLSSVPTKLTIDIRVEGTYYTFYINGVDTTGRAITGSQYIDKIVGLTVDANADITFSNLAIYALP